LSRNIIREFEITETETKGEINSCLERGHDQSFVDTKTSIDVIALLVRKLREKEREGSKIMTDDKGHYKRHVVLKHPGRLCYPGRAYLEKLGIQPRDKSCESRRHSVKDFSEMNQDG
jgi:hypothetical protein